MYLSYNIVNYNFFYQFFHFIKKIYDKLLYYLGVVGTTVLFILLIPFIFIFFLVINMSVRKRHLFRMIKDFENQPPVKKYEFYTIIKGINNNINKPFVFLLFWGFKRIFRLLQVYIERHYFSPFPERLQTKEKQNITSQLIKTFSQDWEPEQLDIYNFL